MAASGQAWKWVPVGLLLLSLSIGAITVVLALNDPGFAVEPDYYQKSLQHDEVLAQNQTNLELGWSLEIEAAAKPLAKLAPLSVRLFDAGRLPLEGAKVKVEAFPLARSAKVFSADLVEVEPGLYRADLPLRRPGQWEFRFRAEARGRLFTDRRQLFLMEGP